MKSTQPNQDNNPNHDPQPLDAINQKIQDLLQRLPGHNPVILEHALSIATVLLLPICKTALESENTHTLDQKDLLAMIRANTDQLRTSPAKFLWDFSRLLPDDPKIKSLLKNTQEIDKLFQKVEQTAKSTDFNAWIDRLFPDAPVPHPITQEPDYSAKHIPEVLHKLGLDLPPAEFKQQANKIIDARRNTPLESNLSEIPIASYKKGGKIPAYITYKDGPITSEVGSMYGCLTGFDEQLLKTGLCNLAVPCRGSVVYYGSLDQLRKRLRLSKGGRQYAQLKKSLKKIGATHVNYSHFYEAHGQKHNPSFQSPLFDYALFLDTEPDNPDILFIFAPPFSDNLMRNYHTFLNDKYYQALPTYLTKRIYEYLHKKIGQVKTTYKENALHFCPKVSITRTRPADKLITLRDACRQVSKQTDIRVTIHNGILIAHTKSKTTKTKPSSSSDTTYPQLQNNPQETQPILAADHPDTQRPSHLKNQLFHIGLKTHQISAIFRKYPIDYLERHLEWLPSRNPRNPAACYLKAVKNNYIIPAQYENAQHRKRTERT